MLRLALEQLPASIDPASVLVRCDSAGATQLLTYTVRDLGLRFSVGFDLTEPVRAAILALPDGAWQPALTADGSPRDGAEDSIRCAKDSGGTRDRIVGHDADPQASYSTSPIRVSSVMENTLDSAVPAEASTWQMTRALS